MPSRRWSAVSAIAVAMLVAACGSDPAAPADATGAESAAGSLDGRIVFQQDYAFYSMLPDGTDVRPIPLGAPNPNELDVWRGRRLAFVAGRERPDIYVADADGRNARRLTRSELGHAAYRPVWSPDGELILYIEDDGLATAAIMDGDGRNRRLLPTPKEGSNGPWTVRGAMWSPDGARVLLTLSRADSLYGDDLWLVNADGSDLHPLTTDLARKEFAYFAFDGAKVVFTSAKEVAAGATHVVDVDGTNERRLGDLAASADPALPGDERPVLSPDGTRFAFTSARVLGRQDVYVMTAEGTGVRRLTASLHLSWGATWSPDGAKLAFMGLPEDGDGHHAIYVVGAGGGVPRRVGPDGGWLVTWVR